MKQVSTLLVVLALSASTMAYMPNPFSNTYQGGAQAVNFQASVGSLPNFTSSNTVQQTVTNTVQAPLPAPVAVPAPVVAPVTAAHTHAAPAYVPPPIPAAAISHSHGPQIPVPRPPAPGMPHMHAGHPYIAPAVAPQNMTYQQIIEYLVNSNGAGLTNILGNGSGNFLTQCKAYCDTLPPSPTCDSTNVLYRNECEAKCIHKTVSTDTLRYGMCCCSDDDFGYTVAGSMLVAQNNAAAGADVQNMCLSTCIFNCLGEESAIETEHSDVNLEIGRSGNLCGSIQ